ncbi:MAG: MarR family transcriptional regulator [Clostridia bacterium]|nr:MarR family transcriptional regulator [Clostridia bacterium]
MDNNNENGKSGFGELFLLNAKLTDVFSRAYPVRTAGVTKLQSRVLYMLDQHGASTMGDLAEKLNAHNSNLTPVVDQLYVEGYVTRLTSRNDRRIVEITITEKGSNLSRSLTKRIDEYVRNLSETERREIKEALLRCADLL